MNRYEEDDLDTLGWFIGMMLALGFLFFAFVQLFVWLEWL